MADDPVTMLHLQIPLRRPFSTAGGSVSRRDVVLVAAGSGWGEAAPFPGQDEPISDLLDAARAGRTTPALAAALDEARADHRARSAGESLARTVGAHEAPPPLSLAVGLADPVGAVDRAVTKGVSRFKIKIAPGEVSHVDRIRSMHPDVVIGLDANGSFDDDTARELGRLADLDIAYLEQPMSEMTHAEIIKSYTEAPVFADESVRSVADAEAMLALDHVDGVVIKPGRLGWSGALVVRQLANSVGKLWRASGLLETGIGRAYTGVLSQCSDAFISDVAPAAVFLEMDITMPSEHGIGVEPDMDLVGRYLIDTFKVG